MRPIVFEIDGPTHLEKIEKDLLREDVLRSIGIEIVRIHNNQAEDICFVRRLITPMRSTRAGNTDKQVAAQKRKLMCKTISCFLSLDEIDKLVADNFNVQLNLKLEADEIINLKLCPRRIISELKSKKNIKKYYKLSR